MPVPPRSLPGVLAHRGVSVEFPENTLEAFGAAPARGADGVELDVRRTADGVLVVHHDPDLVDGRLIIETAVADLPDAVPTLAAVLEACDGSEVNIEIKNSPGEPDFDADGTVATDVVGLVHDLDVTERVIVSSFNYQDILGVRAVADDVATGWLVLDVDDVATKIDFLVAHGHRALHPPADVTTPAVVNAAHDRGILVNTWTVDDPARIVELAEAGVDAVITNDPATARAALSRWAAAG